MAIFIATIEINTISKKGERWKIITSSLPEGLQLSKDFTAPSVEKVTDMPNFN